MRSIRLSTMGAVVGYALILPAWAAPDWRIEFSPGTIRCSPGETVRFSVNLYRNEEPVGSSPDDYSVRVYPNSRMVEVAGKLGTVNGKRAYFWTFSSFERGRFKVYFVHKQRKVYGARGILYVQVLDRAGLAAIAVFRVDGVNRTPIGGPVRLRVGEKVELAAEGRSSNGEALRLDPLWEKVEDYAGELTVEPITRTATFRAGRYTSAPKRPFTLLVKDRAHPQVSARVQVAVTADIDWSTRTPGPGLSVYLIGPGRGPAVAIGAKAALFMRPGQQANLLARRKGEKEPANVRWLLSSSKAGGLYPLGEGRIRLVAGQRTSPRGSHYTLLAVDPTDRRVVRRVRIIVER